MTSDGGKCRIHAVLFTDNNYNVETRRRLARELAGTLLFDQIHSLGEANLPPAFWQKHGAFIRSHPRGFGYWLWKPWIVRSILESQLNEGDVLLYIDSGCTVNASPACIERLQEYVNMVRDSPSGILAFRLRSLTEKCWNKMDTLLHLAGTGYMNEEQLCATAFFVCENANSVKFLRAWNSVFDQQLYHLVDDSPSVAPNDPAFKEHRHDQAIFSIVAQQHGALVIPDETWPIDDSRPINATRKKC